LREDLKMEDGRKIRVKRQKKPTYSVGFGCYLSYF